MKKVLIAALAVSLLGGCQSTLKGWGENVSNVFAKKKVNEPEVNDDAVVNVGVAPLPAQAERVARDSAPLNRFYVNNYPKTDEFGAVSEQPLYLNSRDAYHGQMLTKHVGTYVQNMTQDLVSNMEYLTDETPVGVTTFALTDSDLQKSNLLGFQLAESFLHELHKFRVPVIDYKATDYVRVTEEGDFILSRDFLELKNKVEIEYILTGTMTRHQGGYLVNARILGLKTKAVVASAQKLIPFYVVDALLPSDRRMMDGVKLIQGE